MPCAVAEQQEVPMRALAMEASQEVVAEEDLVRWIRMRHGTREWTTRRADTMKSRNSAFKTQAMAHTGVEDMAT